ncbi:DUF2156 domain-containing protein [soil metagenome]
MPVRASEPGAQGDAGEPAGPAAPGAPTKLTLSSQGSLEPALAALREGSGEQCLSDFVFSNLYLFREAHDYRYQSVGPGSPRPAVSGLAYDGTRHLMPLFDLAEAPVAELRTLLQGHDCFYPVASAVTARLDPARFALTQSADDADYLYAASSFADYPGRALAKKRNQLRQFLAAHAPSSQPFGADVAEAAQAVLQGWMQHKGKAAGEADEAACQEAIAHAERFRLEGFVHFAGGSSIGFVLAQALQPGVFVMRFAKGLDSHVGIYPYMFQHFCRNFPRPVQWLNFEQDMGLPGFRRSKQSYQPAALLPKWRVRLR